MALAFANFLNRQAWLTGGLRWPRRLAGGVRHGSMSALAALAAYLPTHALGLHQGFWSAITAIAVVQMEFRATASSARNQFTGGMIGGLTGLVLVLLFGTGVPAYAAAVLLSVLACWLFSVASASQLAGVTATIIMLVPHTGSADLALISRLSEVVWGIGTGIATVWLAAKIWPLPPANP